MLAKETQDICQPENSQALFNPTIRLPASEMINPRNTIEFIFSLRKNGENKATHNGDVATKTTELATLVYSSEVIQVAKCNPKNTPARINRQNLLLGMDFISPRERMSTNGASTRVAIPSLPAAITKEAACSCAKRINIEAVETAKIPKHKPKMGETLIGFFNVPIRE